MSTWTSKVKNFQRRATQNVLQKIGIAGKTNDDANDQIYADFMALGNFTSHFKVSVQGANKATEKMTKEEGIVASHLQAYIHSELSGETDLPPGDLYEFFTSQDETSSMHAVMLQEVAERFYYACNDIGNSLLHNMISSIDDMVVMPITRDEELNAITKELMEERKRLNLDYDAYRRAGFGTAPGEQERHEAKVRASKERLDACSKKVTQHLTIRNHNRCKLIVHSILSLIQQYNKFFVASSALLQEATGIINPLLEVYQMDQLQLMELLKLDAKVPPKQPVYDGASAPKPPPRTASPPRSSPNPKPNQPNNNSNNNNNSTTSAPATKRHSQSPPRSPPINKEQAPPANNSPTNSGGSGGVSSGNGTSSNGTSSGSGVGNNVNGAHKEATLLDDLMDQPVPETKNTTNPVAPVPKPKPLPKTGTASPAGQSPSPTHATPPTSANPPIIPTTSVPPTSTNSTNIFDEWQGVTKGNTYDDIFGATPLAPKVPPTANSSNSNAQQNIFDDPLINFDLGKDPKPQSQSQPPPTSTPLQPTAAPNKPTPASTFKGSQPTYPMPPQQSFNSQPPNYNAKPAFNGMPGGFPHTQSFPQTNFGGPPHPNFGAGATPGFGTGGGNGYPPNYRAPGGYPGPSYPPPGGANPNANANANPYANPLNAGVSFLPTQEDKDGLDPAVALKIKQWGGDRGKKSNLRALLATMHEVMWPDSGWEPKGLGELVAPASVKKAYRQALVVVHADKVGHCTDEQKLVAKRVFETLQESYELFKKETQ